MPNRDDGGRSAMRALGVAAIALAGLAFALSGLADRLDNLLLDVQWKILRRIDSRPAPDDIVIVGIDEASVKAIPEPPGLWHAALGRAPARLASARPRPSAPTTASSPASIVPFSTGWRARSRALRSWPP